MDFPPPVHPEDLGRGPAVVGISWAFTIVALVAVGLRMYVRKTIIKSIAWDDWLMCLAMVNIQGFHPNQRRKNTKNNHQQRPFTSYPSPSYQ